MKALHLLVALSLLVALAPAASAVKLVCKTGDRECQGGELVCVFPYNTPGPRTCVRDPCYTTMCWRVAVETDADAPTLECYDVYSRHDVGPVTIVQRSSCNYEVLVFGEPLVLQ